MILSLESFHNMTFENFTSYFEPAVTEKTQEIHTLWSILKVIKPIPSYENQNPNRLIDELRRESGIDVSLSFLISFMYYHTGWLKSIFIDVWGVKAIITIDRTDTCKIRILPLKTCSV
ncbi:MAG: hypothetical protein LBV23_00010 [Deltaproteobacteria bacterium]|jgi:hypothetical protein|nr:hypothetical protein [Deltaproteobacteria bacterium]